MTLALPLTVALVFVALLPYLRARVRACVGLVSTRPGERPADSARLRGQVDTLTCQLCIRDHKVRVVCLLPALRGLCSQCAPLQGQVLCVQFSPDGRLLATASRDATCRIFDADNGSPTYVFAHTTRVVCCAFAPSGTCVATAAADGKVRIFDCVGAGDKLFDVPSDCHSPRRPVASCAFDSSGRFLATGGDRGACVYSLQHERQVAHCTRHRESVTYVSFSPNGSMLATASTDRTVLVRSCSAELGTQDVVARQGLHVLLHLQSEQPVDRGHNFVSKAATLYAQTRQIVLASCPGVGSLSLSLPFYDVNEIAIGPKHVALLLADGRVCRVSLVLNEQAVQAQVEQSQPQPSASPRSVAGARARQLAGLHHRRERYAVPIDGSETSGRARSRNVQLTESQHQQLRGELWEHQRERGDRERAGRAARGSSSGGRSGSSVPGRARASQAAFAYHPAESIEMRGSASLGVLRRGGTAAPPESMIQAVQEMFGSVPRDIIVRDLTATGSMEATIDRLLNRNGDNDPEPSNAGSSPAFDGSVLAALSRTVGSSSTTSSSAAGSMLRAARAVPRSQRSAPTSLPLSGSTADSVYSSLLGASSAGSASSSACSHQESSSSLPTYLTNDFEWWDVETRFTSIAAMLSDLIAVGQDGQMYQWSWSDDGNPTGCVSKRQARQHQKVDLVGEKVKQMAASNTHGVVVTTSGAVVSWLDSCFDCRPVDAISHSTIASIEHGPTKFSPFESDPIVMLDVSNFLTLAVTASGKVFQWGLKPPNRRRQRAKESQPSKHFSTKIEAGCRVTLKEQPFHRAGALACYVVGGVACLCELSRTIVTMDDDNEHEFRVLPWGDSEPDSSHGRPASKKLRLSEVLFLAHSEPDKVGHVLKVEAGVAAVDFSNSSTATIKSTLAEALQRCTFIQLSQLQRVDDTKASSSYVDTRACAVEHVPQRMHIGIAGNCTPVSCSITDYKVTLLLRRGSDGQLLTYVADLATQKFTAQPIRPAMTSLFRDSTIAGAFNHIVSGCHSSCVLVRDGDGAAFPARGLPSLKCAAISQRALPYFDYSCDRSCYVTILQ
jgi:hypothetical protein